MTAAPPPTIAEGLHANWRTIDLTGWRWPNFQPDELACRCGGKFCKGSYFHQAAFLDRLQALRKVMGGPLRLTSVRRCPKWNAAVGGASQSQHKLSVAADIDLDGHDPVRLAKSAVKVGFTGIGFGRTFLHVDQRARRTGFHYPGGREAWTRRFGFDPVARLQKTGAL